MAEWSEFESAMPEMAAKGRALFYQFGIGLGFLATVRPDGGPRMHPMCPIIADGGLFAFIIPSPKRRDLVRDGRYAMHSFPPEKVDDEFYITGSAVEEQDPARVALALAAYEAVGGKAAAEERCFRFQVETALLAVYETRPQWPPAYTKWAAPGLVGGD